MEKLAYLQNKWKEENRIAEEGRRAAIRYERKLERRRERNINIITVIIALTCIATYSYMFLSAFGLI